MKEFSTAARRGVSAVNNAVDIEFKLDDHVLTAHPPTTGQIALMVQHGRNGGLRSVESLFEFFSDILDPDDWKVIEDMLRDGLDVNLLNEINTWLLGEWSGRPTPLSSVSSPTPNGTGGRSTVKRAAKGSTSSRSRSTGSSTSSTTG